MTTATEPPKPTKQHFDPDEFRMTIGEHLEELRKRLIYGLLGFAAALIFFMVPQVGMRMITIFCAPLIHGLQKHGLPTQLHVIGLTEGFMTYLTIAAICALVVAGPWLIYQLWLFVAAGLYPNERKTVTRYIPLSMSLLIAGVLFVYFAVLPLTVDFFLTFNGDIPLPPGTGSPQVDVDIKPIVTFVEGDPIHPKTGALWFNNVQSTLKLQTPRGLREVTFTAPNLIASTFTLDDYIGFVLMFMVVFGVAFQLPLVMLALVSVGLVETEFLRKQRKIVWFIMAIVAAVIAPGDVVTSMLALLIPMVFLYEFGIWLAEWGIRRRAKAAAAEEFER